MKRGVIKNIYVSAASRGLGFSIALLYAKNGHAVAISSRKQSNLELAKERILEQAPRADIKIYEGDLSNSTDQENILESMKKDGFTPDIFVCSNGQPANTKIKTITAEQWAHDTEMISRHALFSTKYFLPHMVEHGYGRFIFISSTFAKQPSDQYLAGTMARAGLYALSKAIVDGYAQYGIASFVIGIGYVDTPLLRNMALNRPYDAEEPVDENTDGDWHIKYEEWAKSIPNQAIGDSEELADLIGYLSADSAYYINGNVFSFSGGMDKTII